MAKKFAFTLDGCERTDTPVPSGSHVGLANDRVEARAIICAALDNLTKGASGQAVQNMNLMLGFPETLGLEQVALFP